MLALFSIVLICLQDGELDKLKKEVQELRHELADLKKKKQDPGVQEQELDKLEERIEKRLKTLEQQIEAVNRTASTNAFNPRITVFINGAGRADNQRLFADPNDLTTSRIDDNLFLRSAEVDFRASIDPYADGVLIASLEGLPDGSFEVEVEEGYAIIKRLPVIEAAPLGMKLRLGKYRTPFGVSNRLHMHDMPHITRPLVVARFMGAENGDFFEAGHAPPGAGLEISPPLPCEALVLTTSIDVVRAGETGLLDGNNIAQPALESHAGLFWRILPEHSLSIGGSGYWERGTHPGSIYGIDFTYSWLPLEGKSHSIVVGGEFFFGHRRFAFDDGAGTIFRARNSPWGYYLYVQGQVCQPVYLGVRYDFVQDVTQRDLDTRAVSVFVTYYTSEFLRFRLGYERRESDNPVEDNVDTIMLELNIVFGSHPVEPYWVNR